MSCIPEQLDRMQDRMVLRISFINRSKMRYFEVISKQCGQISFSFQQLCRGMQTENVTICTCILGIVP